MSRILPLSPDAIAQIHSSKHITTLQDVVCALVENSLDAEATKVEIRIDFRRGSCTIEDNGSGILPSEFEENGGLGRMHHSSKCHDQRDLHGSTGTYLASLGALSLLSITSQHCNHTTSSTITLHIGRIIERRVIEAPGLVSNLTSGHGTQVTVRDLFGSMPVRVKQRALYSDADPKYEKAWHDLKRRVVALLLAWPKPCVVRIRDCTSSSKALNLAIHHPSVSGLLTEKHLDQLAGKPVKVDLGDALPVVFQAGLAAAEMRSQWVAVRASSGSLSIKGLICLTAAPTKQCQFISIGVHPCSPATGHNALFDVVNKTFANSSFGTIENISHASDEAERIRRRSDRRYKNDGVTQKQLRSQKGVDHCPMFVLQLKLKDELRHHALSEDVSDADLKTIVDLLEATMLQWLTVNHFRPRKRRRQKHGEQQGPLSATCIPAALPSALHHDRDASATSGALTPSQKRAIIVEGEITSKKRRTTDVFKSLPDTLSRPSTSYRGGLSRIKSGRQDFSGEVWEGARSTNVAVLSSPQPASVASLRCERPEKGEESPTCKSPPAPEPDEAQYQMTAAPFPGFSSDDFGSVDEETLLTATQAIGDTRVSASQTQEDSVIKWTDPVTKHMYRVNSRTGVVLPVEASSVDASDRFSTANAPRRSAAINTALTSAGKPLSLARRVITPGSQRSSSWLPGFLKDWNNPVFSRQDEERIPVASFDGPGIGLAELGKHRCTEHIMHERFAEAGTRLQSKLSKGQLGHARVIRQVDRKFILCLVPSECSTPRGETLVLIDQHAASERVILEELLRELCEPLRMPASASVHTKDGYHQLSAHTTMLERPLRFQISASESELFQKHASHFTRWSILYSLSQHATTVTASQMRQSEHEHIITVRALPSGISERCTVSPNLLIELLRSEIWSIASGTTRPTLLHAQTNNEDEHSWLRHIGSCPKGILDMLNSRACRSAIMFNDVLTNKQCEELLTELAKCAFPFMCAHGRVSMVPMMELRGADVVDVGLNDLMSGQGVMTGREAYSEQSFGSAFRQWRDIGNETV